MNWLELAPAYGRDYTSAKAVRAAWNAGQDFIIMTPGYGTYANKRDLSGRKVTIRYANMRKVLVP